MTEPTEQLTANKMPNQANASFCDRLPILPQMRITLLKPDSEDCDECRRRASYRIRFRNAISMLLCSRCAVRLVVGLIELIASIEGGRSHSKAGRTHKMLIRKL
jgi:hypothetical protein